MEIQCADSTLKKKRLYGVEAHHFEVRRFFILREVYREFVCKS